METTQYPTTQTQAHNICQKSLNSVMIHSAEQEKEKLQNPIMSSNYGILSPPSSTLIGDYIGVESCLDLRSNEDISKLISEKEESSSYQSYIQRRIQRDQRWTMKREIPPPIPLLAQTGNLPSRMPCVLKRYYTGDGRLILRKDSVMHHEYFRAHRSDGRLTLQLVPMDDDDNEDVLSSQDASDYERDHESENQNGDIEEQYHNADDANDGEEEAKVESQETLDFNSGGVYSYCSDVNDNDDDDGDGDHVHGNYDVAEEVILQEDQKSPTMEIGNNAKCLNYIRRSPSCIFGGVPVPALKPVS